MSYSKGYHPMPKISFFNALPVGTESMHETVDLELLEETDPVILEKKINSELPSGLRVLTVKTLGLNEKKAKLIESHFRITLNGTTINKNAIDEFMATDYFPIIRTNKKGEQEINARELVNSMRVVPPNAIEMSIRHGEGPNLRPVEIIKSIFSFSNEEAYSISILKTEQKLKV